MEFHEIDDLPMADFIRLSKGAREVCALTAEVGDHLLRLIGRDRRPEVEGLCNAILLTVWNLEKETLRLQTQISEERLVSSEIWRYLVHMEGQLIECLTDQGIPFLGSDAPRPTFP